MLVSLICITVLFSFNCFREPPNEFSTDHGAFTFSAFWELNKNIDDRSSTLNGSQKEVRSLG